MFVSTTRVQGRVRHGGVTQPVKRERPVEPGLLLPFVEEHLHPTTGKSPAREAAKQRGDGIPALTAFGLVQLVRALEARTGCSNLEGPQAEGHPIAPGYSRASAPEKKGIIAPISR